MSSGSGDEGPEAQAASPAGMPDFEAPAEYLPRRGQPANEPAAAGVEDWRPERLAPDDPESPPSNGPAPTQAWSASASADPAPAPVSELPPGLLAAEPDPGNASPPPVGVPAWLRTPATTSPLPQPDSGGSRPADVAGAAEGPASEPEELGTPRWVSRLRIVVAALAVVLALTVWLTGGFETEYEFRWVDAGSEMNANDLIYTLDHATAQRGASAWKVLVYGTVANPNQESLAPAIGTYGSLALQVPQSRLAAVPGSYDLGAPRQLVAPGDRVSMIASFSAPAEFVPGDTVQVAVIKREHTNNSILALNNKAVWNTDSHAEILATRLPVEVLPPGA